MPLPPYIERISGQCAPDDRVSYQTEYAKNPGAVAAPTAGLHFTKSLLNELMASGMEVTELDPSRRPRHILPMRCTDIREHRMHRGIR